MSFADLKLGTKQTIGFGIILVIMAGINIYSIHKMETIKAGIDEVTSNWLPRAIAISEINRGTSDLRINQLQHAFTTMDSTRQQQIDNMILIIDRIDKNLDVYDRLKMASEAQGLYSENERQLFQAFEENWEEYQDSTFAFFELVSQGKNREAAAKLTGATKRAFDETSQALLSLVEVNKNDAYAAAARAEVTFERTRNVFRALLIATVILSGLFAITLVRYTTVPVKILEHAAGRVAQGDLEVQVDFHGKDEIGSLARSFNSMTRALRAALAKTEEQAAKLRKQNEELERTMQELRNSQEQLLLQEKMASLGHLVAGLAHEINNPIGSMNASADVAKRCIKKLELALQDSTSLAELHRNNELPKVLRILRDNTRVTLLAGERIATIVRSLRNFARLDEAAYQRANIHEGIDSSLTLLGQELHNRIAVRKQYGDIPEIQCYPGQLNQVFLTILKNAANAIKDRGAIDIRTFVRDNHIQIEISDTGCGIPPERIHKLFDFGFSAGDSRVRMSSGLSTSYSIVRKHNGQIKVESKVGQGTTFSIMLPVK